MLSNGYLYKRVSNKLLFREDSMTGRVWYRNLTGYCVTGLNDTDEILIQDMSLIVGDTFNIKFSDWRFTDTLYVVDSVYYQSSHKMIRLKKSVTHPNVEIIFIEGIGPNRSIFFMTNDCSGCLNPYLLCSFKDSIQTSYVNTKYNGDCDPVFAGVSNIPGTSVTIYPIPSSNSIHIDGITDTHADYSITDLTGRQLLHDHLDTREIDIHTLPSGIYLLNITTSGQHIVGRILKE